MPNLNKMYKLNRDLKVPELQATFEITGQGTPYIRKNGSMQKVGFLLMRTRLLIDYQDHTISVGYWNDKKHNFDYEIQKQEPEPLKELST